MESQLKAAQDAAIGCIGAFYRLRKTLSPLPNLGDREALATFVIRVTESLKEADRAVDQACDLLTNYLLDWLERGNAKHGMVIDTVRVAKREFSTAYEAIVDHVSGLLAWSKIFEVNAEDDFDFCGKLRDEIRVASLDPQKWETKIRQECSKALVLATEVEQTVNPDELVSAPELAKKYAVPVHRLKGRLETYRSNNDDGWKELENPSRHAPKYFYRPGSVQHICTSLARKICVESALTKATAEKPVT